MKISLLLALTFFIGLNSFGQDSGLKVADPGYFLHNLPKLDMPIKKSPFAGNGCPPSAENVNQRPPPQTDH